QRTAHIAITLKTKKAANQIIRHGISMEGKKVYGRKLLPEPTRCLKCQLFDRGHIAADCPQKHDTCGTCGADHRTSSCSADTQELYHCANCNTDGHASWSRECPIFITRWQVHKAKNEEARYKYFPMEDPLTWDKIEGEPDNNYETNAPPPQQHHHQPPNKDWKTVHQRRRPQHNTGGYDNINKIPLGTQTRLTDRWSAAQNQPVLLAPPMTQQLERPQSPSSSWTPTPDHHTVPLPGSADDQTGWD
ncbi:hypothetical protein F4604DRAFT_1579341, partial [Suillus subluteus]